MLLTDLTRAAAEFTRESQLNYVADLGGLQIFEAPLIAAATANANDPLFTTLKDPAAVGSHHLLPAEWLPSARTVIAYFLPFTPAVRQANRGQGDPATEWLYGRIEGQVFNNALSRFLADKLAAAGYAAAIPAQDARFAVSSRRSNWSERHVAFIAGLGTLSLNCSIITAKGAAGRLGSVITDLALEPTTRAYSDKYEYCSHCGACIRRCPPQAIDEAGKSHPVCSDYLDSILARFKPRYGCGKCQTGVPCEDRIPARREK
jgi:epoxyqueuosine reductase